MPAVAINHHLDSTNFRNNVRAFSKLGNGRLPCCEYFVTPARITTNSDRAAEVVEYDSGIGEGLG